MTTATLEIDDRELTLAFAQRQLLNLRPRLGISSAVERLVAIQAQNHASVAQALAARLDIGRLPGVDADLNRFGGLRKGTLMRGTLHVVTERDHRQFAGALRPSGLSHWRRKHGAAGADEEAIVAALRAALRRPCTVDEVRAVVAKASCGTIPERHLMHTAKALIPLVHHVEPGVAVVQGRPLLVQADDVATDVPAATAHLVARYLAGFGPASRRDIATFTSLGLRTIDAALTRINAEVRFRDSRGRTLVDLLNMDRVAQQGTLPTRFLPKWDSALLGHDQRDRILPNAYREKVIIRANGDVKAVYLVDGLVAGTWEADFSGRTATLTLHPLGPADGAPDLEAEADRWIRLLHPRAERFELRTTPSTAPPRESDVVKDHSR